jgi:hypothetical protein
MITVCFGCFCFSSPQNLKTQSYVNTVSYAILDLSALLRATLMSTWKSCHYHHAKFHTSSIIATFHETSAYRHWTVPLNGHRHHGWWWIMRCLYMSVYRKQYMCCSTLNYDDVDNEYLVMLMVQQIVVMKTVKLYEYMVIDSQYIQRATEAPRCCKVRIIQYSLRDSKKCMIHLHSTSASINNWLAQDS